MSDDDYLCPHGFHKDFIECRECRETTDAETYPFKLACPECGFVVAGVSHGGEYGFRCRFECGFEGTILATPANATDAETVPEWLVPYIEDLREALDLPTSNWRNVGSAARALVDAVERPTAGETMHDTMRRVTIPASAVEALADDLGSVASGVETTVVAGARFGKLRDVQRQLRRLVDAALTAPADPVSEADDWPFTKDRPRHLWEGNLTAPADPVSEARCRCGHAEMFHGKGACAMTNYTADYPAPGVPCDCPAFTPDPPPTTSRECPECGKPFDEHRTAKATPDGTVYLCEIGVPRVARSLDDLRVGMWVAHGYAALSGGTAWELLYCSEAQMDYYREKGGLGTGTTVILSDPPAPAATPPTTADGERGEP